MSPDTSLAGVIRTAIREYIGRFNEDKARLF
jgi:hypothetical protein